MRSHVVGDRLRQLVVIDDEVAALEMLGGGGEQPAEHECSVLVEVGRASLAGLETSGPESSVPGIMWKPGGVGGDEDLDRVAVDEDDGRTRAAAHDGQGKHRPRIELDDNLALGWMAGPGERGE